MEHNIEIHYLLSIIAIILAIVLLIITLSDAQQENENHFKTVLEIFAHMITFYVSYDIIKQYCKCDKQE